MKLKNIANSRFTAVVGAAAVIGMLGATAGYAAGQIGSAQIKDNSVRGVDVKNGSLRIKDLSNGTVNKLKGNGTAGPAGPAGPVGPAGAPGAPGASGTATYAGPNWSIIDRNVEGGGDSYLRSGPATPPMGIGSLGMRTGATTDKAAFGNQVDFAGLPLAGVTTVKYGVYTTGENNSFGATNLPGVTIEIDPSGPANTAGLNYSSLVYVPVDPTAAGINAWSTQDGTTAKQWFLTGNAGAGKCDQTASPGYCTLAQVKAFYPDATLFTAAFAKGKDNKFSGAVDKLQISNKVYNFEPFGVTETPAP